MEMTELKLNNIDVGVTEFSYTAHLIYHQFLFKGCIKFEEFQSLADQVFDGVATRFNKLIDLKVKKDWKFLPQICFSIYTVGNWI